MRTAGRREGECRMLLRCIVISAAGFVSGSLMFSYYIPKFMKHVDVRKVEGSDGNPGSSNAIRAAGLKIGVACMVLDVAKAFVPVYIAVRFLGLRDFYLVPAMAAPILGHAFSPLLGFKGGKAISTLYGAMLAVFPISRFVLFIALTMAFFRFIVVVRPDSAGVVTSMCVSSGFVFFFEPLFFMKVAVLLISAAVVLKEELCPDPGAWTVSIGRYSCVFDKGVWFHKI